MITMPNVTIYLPKELYDFVKDEKSGKIQEALRAYYKIKKVKK